MLLLGLLLLALPASGGQNEPTGPDSFLQWRAYTVEALMEQVDSDPVLRKRLAKHFHVPEAELAVYLRENLKVVTFETSGWRTVYGVTKTGRIYKTRGYFKKGAKAFGLADGTPLLKYACGNPLIETLPPVERKKKAVEAPPFMAPEQPAIELPEVITPPTQAPEEFVLSREIPIYDPVTVPDPVTIVEKSRRLPLWPLVGLAFTGGGGGDGPPITPIPEPSSLLLFGAGLPLLVRRLLRRGG
jgi:hypothetical protein